MARKDMMLTLKVERSWFFGREYSVSDWLYQCVIVLSFAFTVSV